MNHEQFHRLCRQILGHFNHDNHYFILSEAILYTPGYLMADIFVMGYNCAYILTRKSWGSCDEIFCYYTIHVSAIYSSNFAHF